MEPREVGGNVFFKLFFTVFLLHTSFRPCKSRSRIAFFLLRKHKFQVDLVVGIVVNQYSELSTFRKEIIEVLADLDNLVYGFPSGEKVV